ncbi:5-oxoprolinase subunit PxpA [Sedimentitalea sp. JM2-8]|uniref:5-oxoprolinase subunit A n=1 Tax=Sedimentitalea xiamensis TaxID=3050037 RepID=A0ABT7FI71_9RHOB|nr:5-oxoprolinase subunit PxpA [Sedimentitalea xiamensis]MDK3074489.1 5-oxoprolinase subunit PxpA [Sedimentitalea xiamensis]
MQIDLNSDLGEGYGPWAMGDDRAMLDLVTSANVACGGHASDPDTMFETLTLAAERGVVIGAHPGYPDRTGFGRRVIPMAPAEISRMVAAQVGALQALAALARAQVRYVKPHGALGNLAADDRPVADAIVDAVRVLPGELAILAISGSELELAGRDAGLRVYSEVFADRAYLPNGRLVPRSREGAVLHDPEAISERLIRFLATGNMPLPDGGGIALAADSICVHGDTPGAVDMARRIRERLAGAGILLKPFVQGRGRLT